VDKNDWNTTCEFYKAVHLKNINTPLWPICRAKTSMNGTGKIDLHLWSTNAQRNAIYRTAESLFYADLPRMMLAEAVMKDNRCKATKKLIIRSQYSIWN